MVWAVAVWIVAVTFVFLLLQAPAEWTAQLNAAVPQATDVRAALRSLVYRDFAY